ncbi:alpha-ketoglutarate-dependent dioxygenase AlkB family protein [Psychrobacter sp. SWN149]|uniref:alpha-ketoglutarate-dependent dioxygenase AlkB family protein n=1 Tax=Psychrobacter sp. SWN149 TaxID=2792057 RepID=UPI0018CE1FC8|nr:alpha-ketoglutarate-dependent dioxygenase AlkB [Psychrobacter sp. SWN149]MBH0005435.1 alpha-ketoglutarate-dependent dioxygenase AlkB [Psychrobacter sp. SWN149]
MTDLFAPAPTDNLLPYDGKVNDLGVIIDDANTLYNTLLTDLPWQSDIVTLFGKTHVTTRQIVWMGDTEADYQYSGHVRQTVPWSSTVFHVKQYIEQALAKIGVIAHFNTCLLNYYPTGSDGMGYHADDEKELGAQPIIASLSLGATRKFVFKHKKTQDKVELHLESGQLVVMHGDTQTFWKHTITKTKKVSEGRMSLTFRQMVLS